MAVTRRARASWRGDLAGGSGEVSLDGGAATGLALSWRARTQPGESATSPEELIAAAHAGCFSMALSHELAQAGASDVQLDVQAECGFGESGGGFAVTGITLRVRGQATGVDEEGFRRAAEGAKENCPVSKALAGNVPISLDAELAAG